MRGLINLGNTCYLNAAAQCLLHVPPLTNYLTSDLPEADAGDSGDPDEENGRDPGPQNGRDLAFAYTELARAYWTTPVGDPARPIDTRRLWTALCGVHPAFGDGRPHDAHEALVKLLEAMRVYRWHGGHSVVSAVFEGRTETRVTSPCGFHAVTHERPVVYELDVCPSLAAGFAAMFRTETVDRYVLPDGRETTVTVQWTPTRLPRVLVVHLKRFDADAAKLDRFVDYSTTLDLTHWGDDAAFYDLFAACFHGGSHYTASCEVGGAWYSHDDDRVARLDNIDDIVHRDAYILFFKQRAR